MKQLAKSRLFLISFISFSKIYKMDKKVEVEQAKAFLQGRRLDDTDNAVLISRHVTHFEVDLSADGVQFFDNSEQSECIPICMIVHSVSESTDLSKCKRILLKVRKPVIIGVAHCKTKPDVKKFLAPLIQELVRLMIRRIWMNKLLLVDNLQCQFGAS